MSSTPVLSPQRRILIAVIIISLSFVVIPLIGFPEALLFFCGASTGAILTIEFRYKPVSTGEKIKRTLLSPQVGKYMFIGVIVLVVLIGGLWGAGTFAGIGPFAESNEISGTVYDSDGEPAEAAIVEIDNEGGESVSLSNLDEGRTETDDDGTYKFELAEGGGNYTIRVSNVSTEYSSKTGISPSNTSVNFGEPPDSQTNDSDSGIFGGWFSGDDSESDDQEATSNDSGDTSSSESGTSGGEQEQEQIFAVLNGTVVDSNGDPISSATVTIEYDNGDQLTQEQETGQDGQYRYENVPYEGDIQNITLVWKASEEGYIQEDEESVDLGRFLTNEEEGIEREIRLRQEDIDGE